MVWCLSFMPTYISQDSDSFPTFDAAVVIPGEIVGLTKKKVHRSDDDLFLVPRVCGGNQSMSSGSTYMRRDMQEVLEATIEGSRGTACQ